MTSKKIWISAVLAAFALSACGQGAQGPPNTSSVNTASSSYGSLQFAVGTANIYGTATGLNVVSTFRQSNGLSAVLVSTPQITGPLTVPTPVPAGDGVDAFSTLPAGPSAQEAAAGGVIEGTSQSVNPALPACDAAPCPAGVTVNTTSFGESGGVFGMGLQPANETNNAQSYTYTPYAYPLYDDGSIDFMPELPWGGPPAYDPNGDGMGVRDGTFNIGAGTGVQGVVEGISVFRGVVGRAGTYTLNLTVPTSNTQSGGSTTAVVTKAATLAVGTAAPVIAAATAPTLVEDGAGGGTFAVVLPAGATEALVNVVDYGPNALTAPLSGPPGPAANCQGTLGPGIGSPVYYTVVAHASGTVTLPDTNGPNLQAGAGANAKTPSPTICTAAQNTAALGAATGGDTYTVQLVAVNYPLYEMSQLNKQQSPTITGAAGQSDISFSAANVYNYGGGAAVGTLKGHVKPLSSHRNTGALKRH